MIHCFKNYLATKNLGIIYQFIFAIILPIAVFIPLSLPILTHLIALTFLLELIEKKIKIKQLFKQNIKVFCYINILSLISFLSILTSISPKLSSKSALHLIYYLNLGFFMYCSAQVTTYKTQILKGIWISFVLGLIFSFIESYSKGFIIKKFYNPQIKMYKYNKFTSLLSLLLPFIFLISFKMINFYSKFLKNSPKKFLFFEYLIKITFCFVYIYIIFHFKSDTSKIAIILNIFLIPFFFFQFLSFEIKKIFTRLLVCIALLMPLWTTYIYKIPNIEKITFQTIKKVSFYDRLSIWEYVRNLSLNRGSVPRNLSQQIFGFGINTSKVKSLSSQQRTWISPVKVLNSFTLIPLSSQAIPLHPHNFFLQIWLELGYLGIIVVFLLLNIFINYIFKIKSDRLLLTVLLLSFFNFITIASIGYGIWQSWWLSCIIITIILSRLFQNNRNDKNITNNETVNNSRLNFDFNNLMSLFQNKRVLITGCGISIGYELYQQISSYQPSHLSLVDDSEHYINQYFIAMHNKKPSFSWQTFLCDFSNLTQIKQIMMKERPDIIFHIASLKHVFLAEKNPLKTILATTISTKNIAEAAQQHAKIFVLISIDESLNPSNIFILAMRLAEKYCQSLDQDVISNNNTRFIVVRLSNIMELLKLKNSFSYKKFNFINLIFQSISIGYNDLKKRGRLFLIKQ